MRTANDLDDKTLVAVLRRNGLLRYVHSLSILPHRWGMEEDRDAAWIYFTADEISQGETICAASVRHDKPVVG